MERQVGVTGDRFSQHLLWSQAFLPLYIRMPGRSSVISLQRPGPLSLLWEARFPRDSHPVLNPLGLLLPEEGALFLPQPPELERPS